jgi:proline iminopeptidase
MSHRLLSALALVTCACAPRSPAGSPDAEPKSYVDGYDGVRLRYVLDGTTGDTIIVLHGGPGLTLETLRPDLAPLARRHHLLHFDQRGSGYSELPDSAGLTAEAMVEDIEAVRRHFGLERVTLLGHSWGGGLALLYAMRYPARVDRLVLVGSLPLRGAPWIERYVAIQKARRGAGDDARMAALDSVILAAPDPHPACREQMRLFLRGVAATPAQAGRITGDGCAATSENLREHGRMNGLVWQSFADTTGNWDWRGLTAELTMPALVVHGADDPLLLDSAKELAAGLANARLVVIPGAGHYPHAEQPKAFFPPVEAFLDAE